jgi:predicted DCC family thiol-disulfide oxidoreductase YuxK
MRFAPIQTTLAQAICMEYDEPADVSTAILIDELGSHTHSTAVLRMFLHMGFFYKWFAIVAMIIFPAFLRDAVYKQVAKNRGRIWKGVKKVTGLGDTMMEPYKNRILGVDEYPGNKDGWGFEDDGAGNPDETEGADTNPKAE